MRRWIAALTLAVALVTVAVAVGFALDGRGPLAPLICGEQITSYAQVPRPAPPLAPGETLRVGDRRAVGGYGDPLPTGAPHLSDDSLVTAETLVYPTRQLCDRATSGYRFTVLTARRPGELTVTPAGTPPVTLRIVA